MSWEVQTGECYSTTSDVQVDNDSIVLKIIIVKKIIDIHDDNDKVVKYLKKLCRKKDRVKQSSIDKLSEILFFWNSGRKDSGCQKLQCYPVSL